MELIVITPEANVPDETTTVNKLFAAGLAKLHLRKPGFTTEEYRNYIGAIDERYHKRIVLCGGFEIWNEFKLGGVHLSSSMRNDENTWDKIEDVPMSVLSTSFHSWDEVKENSFPYRYVFVGPVFDSVSKEGHKGIVDVSGAKETKAQLAEAGKRCPALIALSGVAVTDMRYLHRNGFDGAAMLGTIWQSPNPVITLNAALSATVGL